MTIKCESDDLLDISHEHAIVSKKYWSEPHPPWYMEHQFYRNSNN